MTDSLARIPTGYIKDNAPHPGLTEDCGVAESRMESLRPSFRAVVTA